MEIDKLLEENLIIEICADSSQYQDKFCILKTLYSNKLLNGLVKTQFVSLLTYNAFLFYSQKSIKTEGQEDNKISEETPKVDETQALTITQEQALTIKYNLLPESQLKKESESENNNEFLKTAVNYLLLKYLEQKNDNLNNVIKTLQTSNQLLSFLNFLDHCFESKSLFISLSWICNNINKNDLKRFSNEEFLSNMKFQSTVCWGLIYYMTKDNTVLLQSMLTYLNQDNIIQLCTAFENNKKDLYNILKNLSTEQFKVLCKDFDLNSIFSCIPTSSWLGLFQKSDKISLQESLFYTLTTNLSYIKGLTMNSLNKLIIFLNKDQLDRLSKNIIQQEIQQEQQGQKNAYIYMYIITNLNKDSLNKWFNSISDAECIKVYNINILASLEKKTLNHIIDMLLNQVQVNNQISLWESLGGYTSQQDDRIVFVVKFLILNLNRDILNKFVLLTSLPEWWKVIHNILLDVTQDELNKLILSLDQKGLQYLFTKPKNLLQQANETNSTQSYALFENFSKNSWAHIATICDEEFLKNIFFLQMASSSVINCLSVLDKISLNKILVKLGLNAVSVASIGRQFMSTVFNQQNHDIISNMCRNIIKNADVSIVNKILPYILTDTLVRLIENDNDFMNLLIEKIESSNLEILLNKIGGIPFSSFGKKALNNIIKILDPSHLIQYLNWNIDNQSLINIKFLHKDNLNKLSGVILQILNSQADSDNQQKIFQIIHLIKDRTFFDKALDYIYNYNRSDLKALKYIIQKININLDPLSIPSQTYQNMKKKLNFIFNIKSNQKNIVVEDNNTKGKNNNMDKEGG